MTTESCTMLDGDEGFAPEGVSFAWDIETTGLTEVDDRVVAIGLYDLKHCRHYILANEDESVMLAAFWRIYWSVSESKEKLIGFNSHGFDQPFIVRRSWKLGVQVPSNLMWNDRYWNECFVDLLSTWKLGKYRDFIKLDTLSKFFGLEGKNGCGKSFHHLWVHDRKSAISYLANDLNLTAGCAQHMGVS